MPLPNEELMSLSKAAKRCPTRPHVATVWRWATRGCRGIQLETWAVGGKRFTTEEALERFMQRTTAAAVAGKPVDTNSTATRRRQIAAAEAELEADGI